MNISSLSKWVLGLLDALALLSIYLTAEIRIEAGLLVLAIFLVRSLGLRIRSLGVLVTLGLSIVCLGIFIAFKFHVYPIVVAAHVGVVVHALLWLGKDDLRDRVLRLSMGFINLTLASALTAEFYLFGSIFAFAILGSIYISLGFLEATFKTRLPDQLNKPLPSGYLKNMLWVSFAVFLVSICLFPLIPRTSWNWSDNAPTFQVGYNDTVDLSSTGQAPSRMSARVALRIISLSPEIANDPREAIPWGLLRGRVLDLFDGKRWLARPRRPRKEVRVNSIRFPFSGAQFEVIREPQLNNLVFKPYGALIGEVGTEKGRSHYIFKSAATGHELEFHEAPDETDLEVPATIRSPRLLTLARSISGSGVTNTEKAQMLKAYFNGGGFKGTLEATQDSREVSAVLERFLFKDKLGSCELFAASGAILLRLMGVPARVVAGFRVTRGTSGGLLTVLDRDAHAWLEYWHDTRGWVPMDTTPFIISTSDWLDPIQQIYWLAEGKWFYWMINFRKDSGAGIEGDSAMAPSSASTTDWSAGRYWSFAFSSATTKVLVLIGLSLFFGLLAKLALGLISFAELKQILKSGMPWSRRRLYFEYLKHERFVRKHNPLPESARAISVEWRRLYLRLRFGPPEPNVFAQALVELAKLTQRLKLCFKTSNPSF